MITARDILDSDALIVAPALSVQDLATRLLESGAEGACVVDGDKLVGVVTAMDLVYKEKNVHLPTLFTFMDAVIPIGLKRAEEEVEKIAGMTVAEIMSDDPITVGPDTDLHDVATLMVEQHLTMIPVVEGDLLLGVVDKRAVLRAAFADKKKDG